ncbi:hypothetical protein ABH905_003013 [Pseudomonas frederiksbergensis]
MPPQSTRHSLQLAAPPNRPLSADSVENSRPCFPQLKSTRPRLKSLLSAEVSRRRCHEQCVKNAFSPVNDQAVLDDRLFQQNRPIAAYRERSQLAVHECFNVHSNRGDQASAPLLRARCYCGLSRKCPSAGADIKAPRMLWGIVNVVVAISLWWVWATERGKPKPLTDDFGSAVDLCPRGDGRNIRRRFGHALNQTVVLVREEALGGYRRTVPPSPPAWRWPRPG